MPSRNLNYWSKSSDKEHLKFLAKKHNTTMAGMLRKLLYDAYIWEANTEHEKICKLMAFKV